VNAIAERMHARTLAMRPCDRDFGDTELILAGYVEQLRIESPALDLLKREHRDGGALGESLEPALGVLKIKPENRAKEKIETAAPQPAIERLFTDLEISIYPTGTDGDVIALAECREQLLCFFDRGREVSVAEQEHLSGGMQHAVADAVSFAAVRGVLDQADVGVPGHVVVDDIYCRVAGAVIYDDDLRAPVLLLGVGQDLVQRRGDAGALAVGRDDDAIGQRFHGILEHPVTDADHGSAVVRIRLSGQKSSSKCLIAPI